MWRLALLVSLFFISSNSFAFGKLGHQLICQLAYEHLPPSKQIKIDTLLANLPSDQKALINRYTYQNETADITFANACTWADAIKSNPVYKQTKPWHYINVERNVTHITREVCKENCITRAIEKHKDELKNATDSWQKTQALMFLGHWLGDIHQPLHVSFASDWGGNKIVINSPDKKCTNLHWLWDECLITREQQPKNQWIKLLALRWQSNPIAQWQQSDQWQWADESFQLVRQADLGYCHIQNNYCLMNTNSSHLYNEHYQEKFSPIVQERLLRAAARLTKQLDDLL
jgi:hypothetical protein